MPMGELLAASATISEGNKGSSFDIKDSHSFLLINEIDAPVSIIHNLFTPFSLASTNRVFLLWEGETADSLTFESF